MMLRYIILFFALSVFVLFASDSVIEQFNARSDGRLVAIDWKTSNENGIARFELERAADKVPFRTIYSVEAKGFASNYSFSDDEAYRDVSKEDVSLSRNIYNYRIKIINKDNSFSYTNSIDVAHNVTSIRRTWGMIKEMFR